MTDIQRHISMCTKHHARWKRMAEFAKTEEEKKKYTDRAYFWLEMQTALVSLWAAEQKVVSREAKKILLEAKSNLFVKLANYGKTMSNEFQ